MTRDRDGNSDNLDVIVIRPDGEFINVEVGLVTRFGKFFMTAQRVYQGLVVRTRGEKNAVVTTAIPTASIHAYPGAKFEGIWSTVSDSLMTNAREMHASEQRSRVMRYHAEWNPPALTQPAEEGWKTGIVHYFNMLSGTGQIEDVDGVNYFVHFKSIMGTEGVRDTFPVLTPMSVVHFQPDEDSVRLRPPAIKIAAVKPIPIEEPAPTR